MQNRAPDSTSSKSILIVPGNDTISVLEAIDCISI